MKPTIEGSQDNFEMVCISFAKENNRSIKVERGSQKENIFDETKFINAEDGELTENNTIRAANGNIINFEERAFKIVKRNRKMKEQKGVVYNFEVEKKTRTSKREQERGA